MFTATQVLFSQITRRRLTIMKILDYLYGSNYVEFLQKYKRAVVTNLLFDGVIIFSLFEGSHRFSALLWCICFVLLMLLILLWGYPALERMYENPFEILLKGNMISCCIRFILYTIFAVVIGLVSSLIGRFLYYRILLTNRKKS